MVRFDATKNVLKVRTLEPLTSNSVNVNQVQFIGSGNPLHVLL